MVDVEGTRRSPTTAVSVAVRPIAVLSGAPVRRLVPAVAVFALALGLTACGSSGGSTTADDSAGSGSGTAVSHVTKTHALFADMTEAMGQATSAKVRFTSAALTQQVTGTGTFRFGRAPAADLSVTVAGQGLIHIVVLPKAFYLKLPRTTPGLAPGKSWIKISSGGDDALSAAFGPMLDQFRQSLDPKSSADMLSSTAAVTRVGPQVVGGVATTKYTATVDLAKVAKAVGGSLATQYKGLRTSQTTTLDYTLWVDAKSLPRKFSTTIETPQGDVTATGTYSDWGAPVTVTPPKPSEIADSSGLSAPAGAGAGA
jgi:hypothetical protein